MLAALTFIICLLMKQTVSALTVASFCTIVTHCGMPFFRIVVMVLLVLLHPLWCKMEYWIIALLAWNIILTVRHIKLSRLVRSMDIGCKDLFTKLVKAVNLHTQFMNQVLDATEESEPVSKRIH